MNILTSHRAFEITSNQHVRVLVSPYLNHELHDANVLLDVDLPKWDFFLGYFILTVLFQEVPGLLVAKTLFWSIEQSCALVELKRGDA